MQFGKPCAAPQPVMLGVALDPFVEVAKCIVQRPVVAGI
ncbi:hypothetical protein MA5S0921_5348 [Mycobacteroides abscessus 5S-0921]|nr:hypothetical protein MA5S0421_4623 [Mycobacteroides abscessus 5S-0421]EIU09282.1 hypothetical protein MA5S0304_4388 [Mycobacteroides abscessus 5S-0304]EIU25341.1 hypothetical protein MA5S0817_3937 [Mycobacteroides abscessus 5S-0817]EIU30093.1 hypothetical protein MA5S1212_4072 [Mycobacteroides abscessus 5S-1212]EIU45372.1 hypothetical protein MA5S1215_4341 [Mycobacteroides abscessus 5S-1215]EIU85756.1 hypothetical protein MA5S0921_5348 [Mycobacteroides abscessus 5S-0921]